MLISDAYSWGPNNILEVVVIPYYGYICSDDDNPETYVFDPHPYGVVYVEQDAYFGSTYADYMVVCLGWWGLYNNWSYKHYDKNGVVVVIERCLFYL